ncbi:MAG: GumC family protein [Ignavibacteriales bacterium]
MVRQSRNNSNQNGKEKSLLEIIHILYKRKWIIFISVAVTLTIAYINTLKTIPIYESTVILKKEMGERSNFNGDFMEIVKMQTQDEVETEIELVKTVEVLGKVVQDLNLFIRYDKLESPKGNTLTLNKPALDFTNPKFHLTQLPFQLPEFVSVSLYDYDRSSSYFIKRDDENSFGIYDGVSEKLIQKAEIADLDTASENNFSDEFLIESSTPSIYDGNTKQLIFDAPAAKIELNWAEVPVGSKFYFTFNSFNDAIAGLSAQISVGKTGKTTLFTVSVKSPSAYTSMALANSVVDKFRESRIDQQKQTIRYSFNFVDEQLHDMQSKLRGAEDNLSSFKSNSQIITIDASSREVVQFLSTLEAEKMSTELKLNEYKNKLEDMKKQMEISGYFDQNFLTSDGSGSYGDPFTSLLSQVADLELERLDLLQKRTENHPDVIALDEQIKLAKQKLSSYNQNTLTAYQILINTLEKKRNDIVGMMSKYEGRLERLPDQENKFAQLLREKDVYEKMFTLLLDKREEMRMAELSKLQDIIVIDPARESLVPAPSHKMFSFLIAIVLGSFAGVLIIFIVELKNSKLVNLDELEADFQIPILSIIPRYTRALRNKISKASDAKEKFVSLIDEQSGFRETYNLLRTKIDLQFYDKKKIFMVTSCEENTGKSTIVSNLAISFAQNSKRILVIDCDLRKAGLSRIFDVVNEKDGLIDYLSKGTHPKLHTRVSKMIDILPTGGMTLDSSNLLNSEKMEHLLNIIDISAYDYVIIDTAPVTKVVDTLILGKYFRDAILVARPDLSLKENVNGGLQDLADAKIKIRGLIANAAEIEKSYYYKHRYGYGYGYSYGENGKSSGKGLRKISLRKKKNTQLPTQIKF